MMQRMKENYEQRSRTYLTRRTPVILRLDGKAFHTYTRGLDKPFDDGLIEDMQETAKYLCENIQGAKLAYTQSDEISILLTDYDNINTDAWFDYQVQKMCSVAASMATAQFNYLRLVRYFSGDDLMNISKGEADRGVGEHFRAGVNLEEVRDDIASIVNYMPLSPKYGLFDCRAFNIPKEEVANYFLARQRDAVKNSISMLAQSLYSHSELHGKNGDEMQELCFQKGHNWNDLHWSKKRGSTVMKNEYWNGELVKTSIDGQIKYAANMRTCNVPGVYVYDTQEAGTVAEKDLVIRSYWELVETPLKFDDDYFGKYL